MRRFYLGAALLLAGCGAPPPPPGPPGGTAPSYVAMAPAIQDSNGKQFGPPPAGMAALYLFNPTSAGPVLNVVVNGREIGRLGTQTWMRAEFAAGEHNVRCIGGDSSGAISIFLSPGQVRFFQIAMNPGQMVCSVREVPPGEGRSAVLMGGRALQRQ
jgi:hypothetical protein